MVAPAVPFVIARAIRNGRIDTRSDQRLVEIFRAEHVVEVVVPVSSSKPSKLHRWARGDRHESSMTCSTSSPIPFLPVAWERVRGNRDARIAGVGGVTARLSSRRLGVETFLDGLRLLCEMAASSRCRCGTAPTSGSSSTNSTCVVTEDGELLREPTSTPPATTSHKDESATVTETGVNHVPRHHISSGGGSDCR